MIQYQILRTNIIRIVSQIVRRITNEILDVKGLTCEEAVGFGSSTHLLMNNEHWDLGSIFAWIKHLDSLVLT